MNVKDNKFLIVLPKVRLTPHIIPVIVRLDPYFERAQLKAFVTSGQRSSMDQLNTIIKYAKRHGVDKEFPEVLEALPAQKNGKEYVWQRAWSRLLNIGVIINPPFPAVALYDYIRGKENRKGKLIGHSPHYFGYAFDIGGGVDHNIDNEMAVIKQAWDERVEGLKGYLPERKNNCIHVDVERIII